MNGDNLIQKKSFNFASRIIKLYKYLTKDKKEFVLSKQILRCGTSIGANIEEAIGGQTKKDFLTKFSISYKECRETIYWIKLLKESDYLEQQEYNSLFQDCEELIKIITAIINSTKTSLKKNITHH